MRRGVVRLLLVMAVVVSGCSGDDPVAVVVPDETPNEGTEESPFVDPGLDASVRLQLRLHADQALPSAALDTLQTLIASGFDLQDLTGISRLASLRILDISDNLITQLAPLVLLSQLHHLDASGNQISDIRALARLQRLQVLFLDHNDISDVTPLISADSLEQVDFTGNPISGNQGLQALSQQGIIVRYGTTQIVPDPCDSPEVVRSGDFAAQSNGSLLSFRSGSRCLHLLGSLTVEDATDDLSPLANLTQVDGTLRIRRTEGLVNLQSLSVLSRVEGDLWLSGNESLESLGGLDRLRFVGRFVIQANPALKNLGRMGELAEAGHLSITSNPLLESLDGLESLAATAIDVVISVNQSLRNLEGLRNLEEVGRSLNVDSNPQLENLQGLRGVRRIGGSLRIRGNDNLSSLAGLDPESIGSITITNNPLLRQSQVNAFVERMRARGYTGSTRIDGNGG